MKASLAPCKTISRICSMNWKGDHLPFTCLTRNTRLQKWSQMLSNPRYFQQVHIRAYSTENAQQGIKRNMECWQISQYGGTDQMNLNPAAMLPHIRKPDDVMVEVHAASINPIDTLVLGGYGSSTWNLLRRIRQMSNDGSEFPLTLGRDFSGVVLSTGKGVSKFKPGDEVWGAIDTTFRQGTLAEYTVVPCGNITRKPKCLSHTDATSIPYVALTTWSALCTAARLSAKNAPEKKVLVLGGSGGVGSFAIQLLKAWGAYVATTCSTEAMELVTSLGADTMLDYKSTELQQELLALPRFDIILDAVGGTESSSHMELLNDHGLATYVTIVTPLLRNFDQIGFLAGGAKNICTLGGEILMGLKDRKHYRWAFFLPSTKGLETVTTLVEQQKILPIVEQVFPFIDVPEAFDKVMQKHNRGKTVIQVKQ